MVKIGCEVAELFLGLRSLNFFGEKRRSDQLNRWEDGMEGLMKSQLPDRW
jgi:hypothetical protein